MNSFNHYAYGAIGEWLYTVVAGINTDVNHPGYKNIIFKPQPGGGLTHAKATIETVYGKVVSGWRIEDNEFIYVIEVPANTTAVVILPATDMQSVYSGKNMLTDLKTVSSISKVGNDLQFSTGSGTYEFRYPVKAKK
jgi:alpha-L-rhamnosidase